jgi:hypothetical protein
MGRSLPLAAAGLLVVVGPVFAQWSLPQSVELNSAAPGAAYLSVADKTDLTGLTAYTIEAWVHHQRHEHPRTGRDLRRRPPDRWGSR